MDFKDFSSQDLWENILTATVVGVFVFAGSFAFFRTGRFAVKNLNPKKLASLMSFGDKKNQQEFESEEIKKKAGELLKMAPYSAPFLGSENAPVEIEGFFDLMCPYTKIFFTHSLLKKTKQAIIKDEKAKLVFRNLPILDKKSQEAAMACACAGQQGRFWQMLEQVLKNQEDIQRSSAGFSSYANEINLNMASFDDCVASKKYADLILQDMARSQEMGIKGSPTFVADGKIIKEGLPSEDEVKGWVE
ncbi:MAG: thioredoxin domain-containing protein [bacterium]